MESKNANTKYNEEEVESKKDRWKFLIFVNLLIM